MMELLELLTPEVAEAPVVGMSGSPYGNAGPGGSGVVILRSSTLAQTHPVDQKQLVVVILFVIMLTHQVILHSKLFI